MGWTDSAVRRYVRDAGPLLGHLNELVRCDITTANPRKAETIRRRLDELEIRIVELGEREEIGNLRPPIDGHQVMTYLSMPPGRAVGEVLEILYERRMGHIQLPRPIEWCGNGHSPMAGQIRALPQNREAMRPMFGVAAGGVHALYPVSIELSTFECLHLRGNHHRNGPRYSPGNTG
jgi:hypothetical protein